MERLTRSGPPIVSRCRKLLRAGVVADLHVYEGMSHAQYDLDPNVPETKEAFTAIAGFFDRDLGK